MNYDPQIIVQFAAALYTRAAQIIRSYTVLGILVGLLVAGAVGAFVGAAAGAVEIGALVLGLIGSLLGGYVGYQAGLERAFALKVQAQIALCQVQIESNTRLAATGRIAA